MNIIDLVGFPRHDINVKIAQLLRQHPHAHAARLTQLLREQGVNSTVPNALLGRLAALRMIDRVSEQEGQAMLTYFRPSGLQWIESMLNPDFNPEVTVILPGEPQSPAPATATAPTTTTPAPTAPAAPDHAQDIVDSAGHWTPLHSGTLDEQSKALIEDCLALGGRIELRGSHGHLLRELTLAPNGDLLGH